MVRAFFVAFVLLSRIHGGTATVALSGQPNLIPQNVVLSSYAVLPGDVITVEWNMANAGSGFAFASFTAVRFGTSPVVPPQGSFDDLTFTTPEIAANSSVHQAVSVTIPAAMLLGTFYLWVVADVYGMTGESSTVDDFGHSAGFNVQNVRGQPNLRPLNITLGAGTVQPGKPLTVMWTLTNSGSETCPPSSTGLRLGNSRLVPPAGSSPNVVVPTPQIAANSSVRFTNVVTIPPVTEFGNYYVWVVADDVADSPLNQSSRLDDAASSGVFLVAPAPAQPNLLPLNVSLSAYSVRPGNLLTVAWTMSNAGNGNCAASLTGLRLGTSPIEVPVSSVFGIQLPTPEISAHSTIRQTNVVTIPAEMATGNYYIWVIADDVALGTINQSSRDDDAARSGVFGIVDVVGQPNLVPKNVLLSSDFARPGDQVTVRWTMRNIGSVTCPKSVTGYGFGQSSTALPTNGIVLIVETPEIASGGAVDQTNSVTIPTTAPLGTYYLWVVADNVVTSSLNQSSRNDDATRSGPLRVGSESPRPNLAPLSVTLNAISGRPGGQITVRWAVTNSGSANCPASITGLHVGTSASAPTTNDTISLKMATPAIASQSSVFQTNVLTIPADAVSGTYYLWVVADDVANSGLNQSSKTDDAARSGPLAIVTELPRPNLVPSNAGLSIGGARPGGQITVTWTMSNTGAGDCPSSTTGLHLGISPTVPPAGDSLNLKIATPALSALSSVRQTNVVTIPTITLPGIYYLWVVADDVTNSPLNQTSKLDDTVSSGPIVVAVIALTTPGAGAVVDPPPSFGWIASDIPNASVYLANKAAPVPGTDPVVVFDNSAPTHRLELTMTNWVAVVHTLGAAENYYWTIGSADAAGRQAYAEWRAFKARSVVSGESILPDGSFRFQLLAPNQMTVLVQGSETLTNWVDVGTVQNTNGTVIFTDSTAAAKPRQVYRAK